MSRSAANLIHGETYAPYWSSRRLIVEVNGPEGSSTIHLDKPFARVGRCPSADVVLAPERAGALVAYFHATDDAIYVCSLGRLNQNLLPPRRVRPGTGIHIGPYRLSVRLGEAATMPPTTGSQRPGRPSEARRGHHVTFTNDDRSIAEYALDGTFAVVGRGPPSSVLLAHPSLARVQWVLHQAKGRLWVINLSTVNGAGFDPDGSEVTSLASGQRARLGDYWLCYRESNAAPSTPVSAKRAPRPPREPLDAEAPIEIVRPRLMDGPNCSRADVFLLGNIRSRVVDLFRRDGGYRRPQLDVPAIAPVGSAAERRVLTIISETNGAIVANTDAQAYPIAFGNGVKPQVRLATTVPHAAAAALDQYDRVLDRLIEHSHRERSRRWYLLLVTLACLVAGGSLVTLCAYLNSFVAALE